jgi:5-methylcytosine-specific restriction protein A
MGGGIFGYGDGHYFRQKKICRLTVTEKELNMAVITEEMVKQSYEIAKQVFKQEITLTTGREILANQHHWDYGSAGDYINNFGHLMRGERYTRTMNGFGTYYFLSHILADYGQDALKTALTAVSAHIEYYNSLNHGNLNNIRQIHDQFVDTLKH